MQEGAQRLPTFSTALPLFLGGRTAPLSFARPFSPAACALLPDVLVGTGLGVEVRDPHHVPLEGTMAVCIVRAIGKATVNFARATQTCRVCSGWWFICTKDRPAIHLNAFVTLLF